MNNEKFEIDYNTESKLKDAISMAISYCEEHIPHADSWSKQGLESHLQTFKELKSCIGNSFVVGHFE